MSNKKYENRYVTSIPFEKKYFDSVKKLLPKGVDVADEINAFMFEKSEQLERESKKIDPSPQRDPTTNMYASAKDVSVQIQTTLDIFGNRQKITEYLASLDDAEKLRDLRAKGHLIEAVCKTKLRKLYVKAER